MIDTAKATLEQLQGKIDAAAREAHAAGMDFVHGPVEFTQPDPFDPGFDIWRPFMITATVKGGPVEPGSFALPNGWTLIPVPVVVSGL
jgi:hypothetical protein